jgi:hypothetical protein
VSGAIDGRPAPVEARSVPHDPRAAMRRDLLDAVVGGAGSLPTDRRRAALAGEVAGPLGALIAKVRARAWTIEDADVEAARAEGHDDDALFEALAAAAVGAGYRRLEAVLGALARAPREEP